MAKENTYESVCQFVCASEDVGCRKTHTSEYQGVRADVRLRFLNLFFWEIFHYPACFWVNLFMQKHQIPKKKRKKIKNIQKDIKDWYLETAYKNRELTNTQKFPRHFGKAAIKTKCAKCLSLFGCACMSISATREIK